MNEVNTVPGKVVPVVKTASSNGIEKTVNTDPEIPKNGSLLPSKEAEPVTQASIAQVIATKEVPAEETDQVVREVNQFVQSVQRDLHFSVDEDSGVTVVRVRDKESGELIRQIPEDIFLNLAQSLKENNSIQLLDTHG